MQNYIIYSDRVHRNFEYKIAEYSSFDSHVMERENLRIFHLTSQSWKHWGNFKGISGSDLCHPGPG